MDCDADDSAAPSVNMDGNLHKILYACLVQILPLVFQKMFILSDFLV
jgi:hypothetical protein